MEEEKRGFFSELKKDKLLLGLVIIILILGVYVRLSHYNEEGLWSDDMADIPSGLLWFYPHSYFPAISSGNFPLGNLVIGAGCMLSGEDFSHVSEVKPMFYPDRELLIGEALTKGEWGCHFPMYVFGILFLFVVAILAFMLLDKYSATFVIAFFSFHPYLLLMSRWIRGDIVFWTLLVVSLIFLWKAYNAEKYSRKELSFFVMAFAFLGLAHSAKETTPIFVIFAVIIFFDKYSHEFFYYLKKLFKSLELKFAEKFSESSINLKRFHRIIIYSVISYVFFFLLAFKLNPKNVYDTYMVYQQFNGEVSSIHFNLLGIFNYFYSFFLRINLLDSTLLILALFLFVKLLFKKGKTRLDKFLVYFSLLGIVLSFFLSIMDIDRIAFPFLLLFIFLMGLSLSKKSILSRLFKNRYKVFFFVFIIAYVILSFSIALSTSPYFVSVNGVVCFFDKEKCDFSISMALSTLSSKVVYHYFEPKLANDETFYGADDITYYYIKRGQHLTSWQFDVAFKQQTGADPTVADRVKYYHPDNESIRYLLVNPYNENFFGQDTKSFESKYLPNDVLKMKNIDVFYVYDLESLKER